MVSSYLNSIKSGDDLWFGQSFIYNTNNITEDVLKDYSISNDSFEKYDDEFNLEVWYRFNDIYSYKKQTMFAREKYVVIGSLWKLQSFELLFVESVNLKKHLMVHLKVI